MDKKKTNKEKLKEVFKINLDDKDGEYYLSYCYQALDSVSLEPRDKWINTPINDWLDAEYKGDDDMKSLEDVVKAISIDLDMSTSCDKCPYCYESDCNEKLLADLLQQIQWLEHENKVLRWNVIDLTKESEQLKRENKKLLENKR